MAIGLEKSVFNIKIVDLVARVVVRDRVTKYERKVESSKAWRAPTLVKDLHIFSEFNNFYRRLIMSFSGIWATLTILLEEDQRNSFSGKAQTEPIDAFKLRFILAPIL